MENYFNVSKILGGQEPGEKLGSVDPLEPLLQAPMTHTETAGLNSPPLPPTC